MTSSEMMRMRLVILQARAWNAWVGAIFATLVGVSYAPAAVDVFDPFFSFEIKMAATGSHGPLPHAACAAEWRLPRRVACDATCARRR